MQKLIQEYQDVINRGLALLNNCSEQQARWKPGPDQWSVLECLDHARETVAGYQKKIDDALSIANPSTPNPRCRKSWKGRVFAYSMEPPYTFKMKTFRVLHPSAELELAIVRDAFVNEFRRFMETLEKASNQYDLSNIVFSSPMTRLVKMNICDAAAFIAAHSRRHIWQAEQLRQWPGYPKD